MNKLVLAAVLALTPTLASADDVYGTWKTQTGETGGYAHVKISGCGGKICGVITKVFNNDNKSSEGKTIIKDMSSNGSGSYKGGTIWAPDTDKTYRSKMSLSGSNLKVSGCVGPICRSQNWTRVN